MKIAFLSSFYPYRGGIAQFNASLYRIFEKSHDVRAFTFRRQYPDFLFPGHTQIVTEHDEADPVPATRILDTINPVSFRKTANKIANFNPELMIMKFWMPFFGPSLGWVAGRLRKSGVKVISILDNILPHERRFGDMALIRYFLKRNDGFIAMSRTVEHDLLTLMPDASCRLKSHPVFDHFGLKSERKETRRKLKLPEHKRMLLYFGFIRDYKGLDLLLQSMTQLDESYHLIVAGEVYGSFGKYQKIIDENNLSGRISLFTRYIDDLEVPDFFSAADVAVLPYKSATQSGIVQIAYQFDLPVIVTDVGGLSEMVQHGQTGLIVNSARPADIAAAIRQYFRDSDRDTFSRNIARKKSELSWQSFADEVLELYNSIT